MLRLKGEDAKKIDSSQETLEKWYEFLEKGAKNIGYGPNVSEHLHDNYDKGLPAENGGIIDLDNSGRAIYRCSIADKALAHWVMSCGGAKVHSANSNYGTADEIHNLPDSIRSYLLVYDLLEWSIRKEHITAAQLHQLLPGLPADDIADVITTIKTADYTRRLSDGKEELFRQAVSAIFRRPDTEIVLFLTSPLDNYTNETTWSPDTPELRSRHKGYGAPYIVRQQDKELLADFIEAQTFVHGQSDYNNFTIYEALKEFRHAAFTQDLEEQDLETYEMFGLIQNKHILTSIVDVRYFDTIFDKKFNGNELRKIKFENKNDSYWQLANEEYFIVSLNPVDKLMCSTKQTFGSCLSLAKEGENSGANSMGAQNGLGLFSTMPSDAMYLTFMTNGKHKNMYWETEEWLKDAENRDKAKAYKYFKMTMRQLTYKTIPYDTLTAQIYNMDYLKNNTTPEQRDMFKQACLYPRLQAGRLYSVAGEIVDYELISAWFMHKVGINSNISGYKAFTALMKEDKFATKPIFSNLFTVGKSTSADFIWWDKYKKRRGIYFDNVTLNFKSNEEADEPCANYGIVKTGRQRTGSHGTTESAVDCNLDTFKFLRGLQSYSMFNKYIKICAHCGELVSDKDALELGDGNFICSKCATEQGYVQCKHCKGWYTEDTAHEHEEIDLAQYLVRGLSKDTMITCKKKLHFARVDVIGEPQRGPYSHGSGNKGYICGSCGEIHYLSSWEYNRDRSDKYFYEQDIAGTTYRFRICGKCISDCVICDCCHEIINMKHSANPVMLMPGKKARVICRDCAENIRMKKAEKEMLLAAIDATQYVLSTGDYDEVYLETGKAKIEKTIASEEAREFLADLVDVINQKTLSHGSYTPSDLLKNINQQIQGMTGRNGKGYPKQKKDNKQIERLFRHSLVEFTLDIIKAAAEGDKNDSEQSTEA